MRRRVKKLRRRIKTHQIKLGRLLAGLGLPEYTILVIFSIIMGIAAGFAGVGLHKFIGFLSNLFYGKESLSRINPTWIFIFIPAIGMLVQGIMVWLAPRQAAQKGVIEIIKAVGLRKGYLPFRSTIFHFFASAICIGTGGTVGPEAPAAQSGAGVVATLGRVLGLGEARQRIFTAAGAGAAIAAIFNTPLGGVFFAIEVVLLNDFRTAALTAFLLASVAASTVSRIILGNEPKFLFSALDIGSYKYFFFYLLLGVVAGLISIGFIRTNEMLRIVCRKIYRYIPKIAGMILVGLLMGLAGYWMPGILGIGYTTMNQILANELTHQSILVLLLLKFFLVNLILAAGGFGGVFAPSLFIGGCLGHLFAFTFSRTFHVPLDLTTYTLVGMGAVLAGVNSVPMAAIMILFEMTNDYHFILPLMVGVVGSTVVVHMVLKGSIYARELERQGYHYILGREVHILESISVSQVMRKDIFAIPENTPLSELIRLCLNHPYETIYTTNRHGKINGVILSSTLRELITEYHTLKGMIVAKDLAEPQVKFIKDTDNLEYALRLFARQRVEEIPVVSSKSKEVVGTLHYQDVLKAYNNAMVKMNLSEGLADDIKTIAPHQTHEVMPGINLLEIEIPKNFEGKTLKSLRLRNRFGVDVVMIERGNSSLWQDDERQRIFPQADYQFQAGDRVIVLGEKDKVDKFKEYVRQHV